MAGETTISIIGNLTADPELRYSQNGLPVANFTIASTPRTYDRQKNEWVDGEALFLRCSIWREVAEQVAQSLTKGMRVIATGRLKQRSYEDREGNKRTVVELEVDEIGPSLRYATAVVTRVQSSRGAGNRQESAYQQQQADAWSTPPATQNGPAADEPWTTPGSSQPSGPDAWTSPGAYGDDTPF